MITLTYFILFNQIWPKTIFRNSLWAALCSALYIFVKVALKPYGLDL